MAQCLCMRQKDSLQCGRLPATDLRCTHSLFSCTLNGLLTWLSRYSPIVDPDGSTLLQHHHESWQAKLTGSHHDDEPEDLVDDPAPRHSMVLPTVAVRRKILTLSSDHLPNLVHLDPLPAEVFRSEARVKRGKPGLRLSPIFFKPTFVSYKNPF